MTNIRERLLERSKREWAYISELEDIVLAKDAAAEIELLEKYLGEANVDEAKFRILWAEAKAENERLREDNSRLRKSDAILKALYAAGIDNLECYQDALQDAGLLNEDEDA